MLGGIHLLRSHNFRIFGFKDITLLEQPNLELRENNRVLVVLTKLNFWPFGLENGLEGQF